MRIWSMLIILFDGAIQTFHVHQEMSITHRHSSEQETIEDTISMGRIKFQIGRKDKLQDNVQHHVDESEKFVQKFEH